MLQRHTHMAPGNDVPPPRMFRYDEFALISRVNPPRGPIGTAAYAVGGAVVKAFAALDQGLEAVGVLPKLQPADPYENVVDPLTNQSMDQVWYDHWVTGMTNVHPYACC